MAITVHLTRNESGSFDRAAHEMGIETVAVHSTADADAMHVRLADHAVDDRREGDGVAGVGHRVFLLELFRHRDQVGAGGLGV